jgi:hypothetical protein
MEESHEADGVEGAMMGMEGNGGSERRGMLCMVVDY